MNQIHPAQLGTNFTNVTYCTSRLTTKIVMFRKNKNVFASRRSISFARWKSYLFHVVKASLLSCTKVLVFEHSIEISTASLQLLLKFWTFLHFDRKSLLFLYYAFLNSSLNREDLLIHEANLGSWTWHFSTISLVSLYNCIIKIKLKIVL